MKGDNINEKKIIASQGEENRSCFRLAIVQTALVIAHFCKYSTCSLQRMDW